MNLGTIVAQNRVGETKYSSKGMKMTIVDYRKFDDVDILFEDGYLAKGVEYVQFKRGTLSNPYVPSVYTYGYLGEGNYKVSNNGAHTRQYVTWKSMLNRCYSLELHKKIPTYSNCTVAEEWHNYQTFGEWYDANYYEIEDTIMALDKDILTKGNKTYSPESCVFVPHFINTLFTKRDSYRGTLPIGVSLTKDRKKFEASCGNGLGYHKVLGTFDTQYEAFLAYKETKEKVIKEIAITYRSQIPEKLFNAMMKYEVEIDD
jgi:hypothetical protein